MWIDSKTRRSIEILQLYDLVGMLSNELALVRCSSELVSCDHVHLHDYLTDNCHPGYHCPECQCHPDLLCAVVCFSKL